MHLPEGEVPEFLGVDQRAQYLIDKGYAADGLVGDAVRAHIAVTNFHYFLGYARNFRALAGRGEVDGDLSLDRVVKLVEIDRELSAAIFYGIGQLEWLLRAALVDAHCEMHASRGCFFEPSHYRVLDASSRPIQDVVREQSLRSREPYVVEQFEVAVGRQLSSTEIDRLPPQTQTAVLASLPIWSLVDSWTLGLIGRVIMASKSPAGRDDEYLWKNVAQLLGVSNAIFDTQLVGLGVFRNQVAHHVRLWMRPTTSSPKLPKIYERLGRDAQPKSMYVAALALASFLRRNGKDADFIDAVNVIIDRDPLFARGIRAPL